MELCRLNDKSRLSDRGNTDWENESDWTLTFKNNYDDETKELLSEVKSESLSILDRIWNKDTKIRDGIYAMKKVVISSNIIKETIFEKKMQYWDYFLITHSFTSKGYYFFMNYNWNLECFEGNLIDPNFDKRLNEQRLLKRQIDFEDFPEDIKKNFKEFMYERYQKSSQSLK
ncbi:MAG: hypothetical protein ACD_4C00142G0002 [uncultured bacterium (gcode 4)]|uniref:Uncharacterized protein n=1 Tax=uncultured bacterium (gcode 4) TaxID=1234023 RepID=K2FV16_9BACT|nr:MAG: hypothetical protein ACD_4C00142G0002 [uncultured bacterium (gcode 4)]